MNDHFSEVLTKMPLAEAVLWLWRWVADEQRLASLFERYRGRNYEKLISFSLMTRLVCDALIKYGGSGHRSFQKAKKTGELEASIPAAYGKLGRLPIPLSEGFLAECSTALAEIFPPTAMTPVPKSLETFSVIPLDGKAIKRVAKRLKPLRGMRGGLLGGRALVALELKTGLVRVMRGHLDGEINDASLVGDALPRIRQCVDGVRLYIGDRQFCDLVQPARMTAEGDHFLLRYHRKVSFTRDAAQTQWMGQDSQGRVFEEEWGWLGHVRDRRRRYVRRITLRRPEDEDVILVTDLLERNLYPAEDLLAAYLARWNIERVFQKVTEVFGLEGLIGGRPEACLFQFAFCMLLYNMIQVVRAYIAEAQERPCEEISTENLFDDVHRELISWDVVVDRETTEAFFEQLPSASELRRRLRDLLGQTWSDLWLKSPPQKRRLTKHLKRTRTHGSVYRIPRDVQRPKKTQHPHTGPPDIPKQATQRC